MLSGAVNLMGKVSQEMLQSGTYSSSIMGRGLVDECFMMTYSYYTSCSENAHHHGEAADEDGELCEAETQSVLVVTQALVCPNPGGSTTNPGGNESGTTPGGFNPDGGSGSTDPNDPAGSNGATNPNQPCGGSGIPSQPQDPSSTLGNEECNNGTLTLPNLEFNPIKTPCAKIKNWFNDPVFKEKYDTITKPGIHQLDRERAFYLRYPTVGTNIPPAYVEVNMPTCATDGNLPTFTEGMGGLMHTHNDLDCHGNTPIKAPSPTDIRTFFNTLIPEAGQYAGGYHNAYSLISTSGGNYMLMYNGTNYPGSINYYANEKLTKEYKDIFEDLYTYNENVTQADIEKVFTKFMKEKINKPGFEIYKVTPTSAIKLEYDPNSAGSVKRMNCP